MVAWHESGTTFKNSRATIYIALSGIIFSDIQELVAWHAFFYTKTFRILKSVARATTLFFINF